MTVEFIAGHRIARKTPLVDSRNIKFRSTIFAMRSDTQPNRTDGYFHIGEFRFHTPTHGLIGPTQTHHLRKKEAEFLRLLIEKYPDPASEGEIFNRLWPGTTSVGAHDLHVLKSTLNKRFAPESEYILPAVDGYVLTVEPLWGELDLEVTRIPASAAVPNLFHGPNGRLVLQVFPLFTLMGSHGYFGSWIGSGAHDWVGKAEELSTRDNVRMDVIMCGRQGQPCLQIPFKHRKLEPYKESWWSAAVALTQDLVTADWPGIDLRIFQKLRVEAHATGPQESIKTIPLKFRLEEENRDAKAGSFRQSTSFSPTQYLTQHFHPYEVQLQQLNWDEKAWHWNTRPVDRSRISQVVFCHDLEDADCEGTIEIRSIRFEQ